MNEKRPRRFLILLCLFIVQQGGQCHTAEPKVRTGHTVSRLYRQQLTHMLNILDEDADPCEDFFAHACGYYKEALNDELQLSVDSAEKPTTVPPYLYNYEDRMHFFERNKANFRTPPGRLLAALYASCKKSEQKNKLFGRRPLTQWRRMLREIPFLAENARLYKTWPLLRHEWDDLLAQHAYLDWLQLAAELAAHGVTSFVRIFFAEATIFVAPIRARQDVRCETLADWQAQLLTFRDNGDEQAAHVIASELRAFCRVLIGELPFDAELHGDKSGQNGSYDDSTLNSFSYVKYFKYYHSSLRFNEKDVWTAREIITDEERLEDTAALIRSTHRSVLFNFVLWQAYVTLRYEDCFLLTDEFEALLLSEYWNWDVFNAHFSRKVALATYLYHTTRFQEQRRTVLLGEQWDRFLYAKLQRSDFNLPRLLSTYAKTYLEPANLTEIYAADKFEEGNFYGNLLTLRRRQLRNTFFTAFIDPEDYNHPIYFLRNFLHFTILSLQRPLFHYFATQGFDLWHKSDLLYSSDGYYTSVYCLERQSLLNYEVAPIYQMLGESQVAELFRFYRAFVESLRDYDFWLEGESFAFAEDFVLEHFQLTSKRIMFYAVAQLHCGRNDDWFSLLINRSFMNMPQFEAAFECDAEAPMNPLIKCMINHCD